MTRSVLSTINLARFEDDYPPEHRPELRAQAGRARGVWARLQRPEIPGVILGDEVGKGKTYVALALAFATLATKRRARVLVLTHSNQMARTWAARWSEELSGMVETRWRDRFAMDWAPRVVARFPDFVAALEETAGQSAIVFASYDTLKRFRSHEDRRRLLLGTLAHVYAAYGIRLSAPERVRLVKEIVADGGRMPRKPTPVSKRAAVALLDDVFDPAARQWRASSKQGIEEFLDFEAGRALAIRPPIDLLIVDEAHKLEGRRRGSVVTGLLSRRFRKGVWVTATPFALTLSELRHRLEQFEHAGKALPDYRAGIDALAFGDFQRAVTVRAEFPQLAALQGALRQQLVRSTWQNKTERRVVDWTGEATGEALLPSMVLERVLSNVLADHDRVFVAAVRQTLCSSWAASLDSLEDGSLARLDKDPWVARLKGVLADALTLDPKLRTAVGQLARLAANGEKTVVFTERNETSAILAAELLADPRIRQLTAQHRRAAKRWRERAPRVQKALGIKTIQQARIVAKILAHSHDAPAQPTTAALRGWWRRHRKSLETQRRSTKAANIVDYLEQVAGSDRRLPVVARYDGLVSGGDEREPDSVTNDRKFNLPCAPLILIASRKGQEGIDLHHYCRRVVLYDLPWNPALIEQRIGRVHRLGGLRSKTRPVEVVYCYQKGGYEELIAQRVKRRCEMMHTLLGAGTWLEQDREVTDLERYRMTFPA